MTCTTRSDASERVDLSTTGGTARPSLFFAMNLRVVHLTPWYLTAVMAALWAGSVAAQTGPSSGVWRCGTLLTNQPRADQSCEPVSTVSSTVVEGTRVGGSRGATTSSSARTQSAGPGVSASDAGGTESLRESARALLRAELHEQEQRWQHLQSMWNQGRPAPTQIGRAHV